MLHFTIGFAFLIILLIPIGFFMVTLIYTTGEELRKNAKQKKQKKSTPYTEEIPIPQRIRVVK